MTNKILKLVEKVMEVNENTKHDVFFNIVPHVKRCDIRIYKGGWEKEVRNKIEDIHFYYNEYYKKEDYDKMINRLEELLND
ncbi:MAG: hypothetical protein GX981_03185 [Tissierellia bacterium]|nr:hypothetical protein [Tissierellia bacterium]